MLPPRGYLFIFLNVVRFLSVVGLLLVFASSVVVLADDIKAVNRFIAEGGRQAFSSDNSTIECELDYIGGSTVPNQPAGVFWAVVNRLLIIFQVVVLLLSEVGWPQAFFNSYFPVLGNEFGLGPLGIFECLIGAAILSHRVSTFAMVTAFFLFSVGCLNMLLGLIFREKGRYRRSVTSWKDDTDSVLPKVNGDGGRARSTASPSIFTDNRRTQDTDASGLDEKTRGMGFGRQASKSGYGFSGQGEKAAGLKGFLITKPLEILPKYAPKSVAPSGPPSRTFSSSPTAV